MWQLYTQTLAHWAHVTGSEIFSVAAIDTFSDLGSPDTGVCNWSIYQLGNGIPSPNGSYSPHSGLFSSYWVYLSYLLQDAAPSPLLLQANAHTAAAPINFEHYRQLLLATRASQTAGAQTGLRTANTTTNAASLAAAHQSLKSACNACAPQIITAMDQCWLASLQQPTSLNMTAGTADTTIFQCPGYTLEQWAQTLPVWRGNGLLRSSAPMTLLDSVAINLPSSSSHTVLTQMLTAADWPAFIELSAANTRSIALSNLSSTSITMSLSVEQFSRFALSASAWFNANFFDGARYPIPPAAADFFSANGAIGLLPSHAVVGFRPHLTLRASNLAQAQGLANSVTRIGPFNVQATATVQLPAGASGSSGAVDIHFDARDSNLPVLLGVISNPTSH
ncbi:MULTISPECIES: hypothetical protein [unclassified Pseudomonas]|uniref:hypothetical protein n=1 Tax=unclassified Pseudomonas TaxID=196821 RepID=UPI002AC948C2|nr:MULTISPECIES: hypothetical protein [unclassified Pseudomonas]MEB0046824.1 hypothetical protein [Pseudomonas sp. Dout3]MEB0099300.1 hypothetical protein [Pseudomonas sp. DC1.2]WPX61218.1 hypothetical protein RHM68_11455 [Pseudomonas sp. DC1.2]